MTLPHKNDLIGLFAQHRVAANLMMAIMILAGIWALTRLNTQFFPNFSLEIINVRVVWSGAAAEDVEAYISLPIEQQLRSLDGVRKMTSTSAPGVSSIRIEYEETADMGRALDQAKEQIALLRNLPTTSEAPEITRVVRYEPVARVLITGGSGLDELRPLARRMERELLERGIAKIDISGLPEEEIAIQISVAHLDELDLTLEQVAERVADLSRDLPAGSIGRNDMARALRSMDQRRNPLAFASLPLVAEESGQLLRLGDVALIKRRAREGEVHVKHRGQAAVELHLRRSEHSDSLQAAEILEEWFAETVPRLPPGVALQAYEQPWQLLKERIMLLVKNGVSGLVLVIAILFLFLHGRVAFWVAVGIPVSFMATQAVLYAFGGSINMLTLFAMIMALGIIVDDAIVVGEDGLAHYQSGEHSLEAAEGGARRMLAPVVSSSLTTISAFLPLMLIGGVIGKLLFSIPLVIICVILASLIESFLVLPGHLRHSFHKLHHDAPRPLRRRLDQGFVHVREHGFRPLVTLAVQHRWSTLSAAVALLLLTVGLLAGGRLNFTFFPTPEGAQIFANASLVAGTPPERVRAFLEHVEDALNETEADLGGNLVRVAVTRLGSSSVSRGNPAQQGDQFGSMAVELIPPDSRTVRNKTFIQAWRERVQIPPGIQSFTIAEPQAGPPGQDVEIRLTGASAEPLKAAALELSEALKSFAGVSGIEDDMPFGQQQLIYRLTPKGESLGLTIEGVGRQLRAAYDGHIAQIFQEGEDELEVRVMLPDAERYRMASLERINIRTPNGSAVPLVSVIALKPRRGFEALRHANGKLAVHVSAEVDSSVNNANRILASLERQLLPELSARYGLQYAYEGRAADAEETLGDMKRGLVFALILIYLVLAWVFASYGWPLVVMTAIPFGLIGALVGHWLLGIDLTILSLFGLFGLSGIVVNDSIILVTFYKHLREGGMPTENAIIEAACQRLRAVLLTSLTTIAGLTPLLFETSFQAQFLIPMAVSIAFGLLFSTLLVLLCIPALLAIHERIAERLKGRPPVVLAERSYTSRGLK